MTGWSGAFTIYPIRKLGKGCIIPAIILGLSILLYCLSKTADPISLLEKTSGFVIAGYPSIIGFVLTGYALIIGLSGSELVRKMANVPTKDGFSLFQVVSSVFAVVLLIVVSTYIVACISSYIIELEIVWPFENDCCYIFNSVCFFLFLFLFYYSIFSLIDVIVNIFDIGQYANVIVEKTSHEDSCQVKGWRKKLVMVFIAIISFLFGNRDNHGTNDNSQTDNNQ